MNFNLIIKMARRAKKAFWPPRFVRSCGERPLCLAPIVSLRENQADCRCGIVQKSSLPFHHIKPFGFTLIELLIVITILAVLTGVALLDYGFSVKKARIQVAAEELVALLQDASVRSQTQFSQTDTIDGAEVSTVVCYGVTIEEEKSPVLFTVVRDVETETCSMTDDPSMRETIKTLSWEDLVFVTAIDWTAITTLGVEESGEDDAWITFLFLPPKGDISVYVYLGPDLPVEKTGMTGVQVHAAYQNSSEPVLNKIIKINPVTSSFMIEQVKEGSL